MAGFEREEEGWILKKENKEDGRGKKMETVGWMAWREGGRGIIMPDTTHDGGKEGGRAEPGRRSPSKPKC